MLGPNNCASPAQPSRTMETPDKRTTVRLLLPALGNYNGGERGNFCHLLHDPCPSPELGWNPSKARPFPRRPVRGFGAPDRNIQSTAVNLFEVLLAKCLMKEIMGTPLAFHKGWGVLLKLSGCCKEMAGELLGEYIAEMRQYNTRGEHLWGALTDAGIKSLLRCSCQLSILPLPVYNVARLF